ncbi:MAG: stage V sporulation protein AE [Lachnospiraceae bacterium]|jgi:stage V sporulation protein AE|nr:stage V sporulation protein AE [Lachnospiraceae bacterium]
MEYIKAFIVGGLICIVGQIILQRTKLTPARIVVIFVAAGAILTGLGVYEPLVEFAGCGATVPLTGFGYTLAKGVMKAVQEVGILGIFTGGYQAAAGGVGASILFGYLASVIFEPKSKK